MRKIFTPKRRRMFQPNNRRTNRDHNSTETQTNFSRNLIVWWFFEVIRQNPEMIAEIRSKDSRAVEITLDNGTIWTLPVS